jgi:hypothetical protein
VFSANEPAESLIYLTIDLLQFFKKGLPKYAILVHAAILVYFEKSSSMICLFLKV